MSAGFLFTSIASVALFLSATPRTLAQIQSENNFQIPPGRETVPIGTLGHVEKRGHGAIPMILVPGRGFGWRIWKSFMQRNVDRYTMYAITAAGYDDTAPPAQPANLEAFENHDWTNGLVDGLVKLIEAEHLDKPVIVGHFLLGDHIALRMGLEHPDLVRSVIVIAGDPSRPVEPTRDGNPDLSVNDQIFHVHEHMLKKYRTMDQDTQRLEYLPMAYLCKDAKRSQELAVDQLRNPAYVDFRYFLEFMTTNLALELPSLAVPLLVVEPRENAEEMIAQFQEPFEKRFGRERAKQQIEKQLISTFGSVEEAMKQLGRDPAWDRLVSVMPNLRLEYMFDTKVFVMEDQPEKLDAMIVDFLEDPQVPSPTDASEP